MSEKGGSSQGDVFDVRRVRRFVELMKEHELAEIDLRDGERRIRLRTDRDVPMQFSGVPAAAPPAASQPAAPPTASTPPAGESAAAPAANETYITSPMVGTFYSAANPDSAPFASVGDRVGPDTVVCIIEAMKVFNEIPAETSGKIAAVLVENGESVEYGQQLFRVEGA